MRLELVLAITALALAVGFVAGYIVAEVRAAERRRRVPELEAHLALERIGRRRELRDNIAEGLGVDPALLDGAEDHWRGLGWDGRPWTPRDSGRLYPGGPLAG